MKNGSAMGTTIRRANGFQSFTRLYADGNKHTFAEVPVLPHSWNYDFFFASGSSGTIILGRAGHIVVLLTGSCSTKDEADVTCLKSRFRSSLAATLNRRLARSLNVYYRRVKYIGWPGSNYVLAYELGPIYFFAPLNKECSLVPSYRCDVIGSRG